MTSPITDDLLKEILDGCEAIPLKRGEWQYALVEIWRTLDALSIDSLPGTQRQFHENRTRAPREHIARLDPATVAAMAAELLAAREALKPFADRFDAWSKIGPGPYEDEEYSAKLFSAMQIAARALSGNRSGE